MYSKLGFLEVKRTVTPTRVVTGATASNLRLSSGLKLPKKLKLITFLYSHPDNPVKSDVRASILSAQRSVHSALKRKKKDCHRKPRSDAFYWPIVFQWANKKWEKVEKVGYCWLVAQCEIRTQSARPLPCPPPLPTTNNQPPRRNVDTFHFRFRNVSIRNLKLVNEWVNVLWSCCVNLLFILCLVFYTICLKLKKKCAYTSVSWLFICQIVFTVSVV